jgi:hypothetical protein
MLPAETASVCDFLKQQAGMNGFILIGGSALSLRINHRISEDLDVAFRGNCLPSARLNALVRSFEEHGFRLVPTDDPAAAFEFESAGQELRDYQQDFLVNAKVKLSFFAADSALESVLSPESSDRVRIASLDELFAAKALVCASRSTTRDWYDMRTLVQDHNFTIGNLHSVFEKVGNLYGFTIALQRLCSGIPQPGDPGLASVLDTPVSIDELAQFFRMKRDEFETQQSSKLAFERLQNDVTKGDPPQRPGSGLRP